MSLRLSEATAMWKQESKKMLRYEVPVSLHKSAVCTECGTEGFFELHLTLSNFSILIY